MNITHGAISNDHDNNIFYLIYFNTGRAREMDAVFKLIANPDENEASRDAMNKYREPMMLEAVGNICSMSPEERNNKMLLFQYAAMQERKHAAESKLRLEQLKSERDYKDEYQLRCKKCEQFAAYSNDLRSISKTHYVVVDPGFWHLARLETHRVQKKIKDMEKRHKVFCAVCGEDWGITGLHNGLLYPSLKIRSFIIIDPNEHRQLVKKWNDIVFPVQELSVEDIQNMTQPVSIEY